ncbi:uncharacterized protein LOC101763778 [Setaria italica]|uniref:uncharacterized protein LOC101763778 n=1 Tax=Setaria italica TaxID=4555 RepID=UPI000BE53B72|nr:uncharacterized protein LOC101763778 [Setaria italica]
MAEAREHVEQIRQERFFIGREERNPLAEDIHQAVTYLSEELYSKDVHFLMKLIQVIKSRNLLLVPADGSKWVTLIGTNPWRLQKYVELSADYSSSGRYAGNCTSEGQLIAFLRTYAQAADIPFIHPPNSSIPAVSSPLAMENALLLLQWIRNLRSSNVLPKKFLNCIKNEKWLKTSVGYNSPSRTFLSSPGWGSKQQIQFVFANLPIIYEEFYANRIGVYKEELRIMGVQFEFANASVHIGNQPLSMENAILLLQWIRDLKLRSVQLPRNELSRIRNGKWLKTSIGCNAPSRSFMLSAEWANLRLVISQLANVPLVDHEFYKNTISSYKEELGSIGVQFEFSYTSMDMATTPLTMENAILLLQCISSLRVFYGVDIADFKSELKLFGVVDFKQNFQLVVDNLRFSEDIITPGATILMLKCIWYAKESLDFIERLKDIRWLKTDVGFKLLVKLYMEELSKTGLIAGLKEATVTPEAIISLLKCIRSWRKNGTALPQSFKSAINVKWVKTTAGYRNPNGCILFESAIGVALNASAGCALMAQHLQGLSNVDKISSIYSYLEACRWKPRYTSDDWIWIPHEADEGAWVNPASCVLYDRNSLFGSQLHVLVKWYNSKLLRYFNTIFGVKHHPTVSDYCKLWSVCRTALAQKDCAAFWKFFGKNWSTDMGKFISGCITKVPVCSGDQILLLEKQDVFILDDLLLEDLFKKQAQQPLFVWYPSASLPCLSPTKLNDIYSSIGIQNISKAVARGASEGLKIEHVTIVHKGLTNVVVYERSMPLTVSYQVGLSSGRNMVVTSARFFCWEREDSRLDVTKTEVTGLVTNSVKMEHAACFAEEISKGLLFENADHVPALAELVRTGFLLDFDVPAVEILLKLKNLRLFEKDEQFLLPYTDMLRANRSCGSSYV